PNASEPTALGAAKRSALDKITSNFLIFLSILSISVDDNQNGCVGWKDAQNATILRSEGAKFRKRATRREPRNRVGSGGSRLDSS
ncbi:MAG: hypothetical protein IKU86_06420, partial [Thermoguttaceae bacterium]|nr:hypothetical protein [Thermoguttaceae bacterium]